MRHQFEMPVIDEIDGDQYETASDRECAVEIEPDEAVACTSWYVARVYVQGFRRRKLMWVRVPEDHRLFDQIKQHALDHHEHALGELWETYLEDLPRRVRPRTDRDEHSTYWGRP